MLTISVQKLLHYSSGKHALQVELELEQGTFLALTGSSGSGKTTLLRLLAGLMQPEQGKITFQGETWLDTDRRIHLPPQRRPIGFVFQDYALFPNMTVEQNLRFALSKGESDSIVRELLAIAELTNLASRFPAQLSGGQQQRVALARALVRRPRLLLLDEPLSALDTDMREHLQQFIRQVQERYALTTLLVSHDSREILRLADTVIQLEQGQIIKKGSPDAIFPFYEVDAAQKLLGEVIRIQRTAAATEVSVLVGQNRMIISTAEAIALQEGDRVWVTLPSSDKLATIRTIE